MTWQKAGEEKTVDCVFTRYIVVLVHLFCYSTLILLAEYIWLPQDLFLLNHQQMEHNNIWFNVLGPSLN